MYGKTIDGVLYVAQTPLDGYKSFVYSEQPDAPAGFEAAFYWHETEDSFVQTWEIVEVYDEIDDSEAFDIIFGGDGE